MDLLQRIWQENKQFILRAGGGFAAFLVLNFWIIPIFVGSPVDLHRRNQDVEKAVTRLRNEVIARAPEEKKSLEELGGIEKDLAARWVTKLPADPPDAARGDPQIQFTDRIDRVWRDVKVKADQKNVRIPEKITTNDLRVSPGAAAEDLAASASSLAVLEHAMKACVEQGMTAIEKPVIGSDEYLPVAGDDASAIVYRKVVMAVSGPYEAFQGVLSEFQKPDWPLQVRLLSLDARGAAGPSGLRGQLEFVGLFLETEEAEAEPAPAARKAPPPRKGARKGRR